MSSKRVYQIDEHDNIPEHKSSVAPGVQTPWFEAKTIATGVYSRFEDWRYASNGTRTINNRGNAAVPDGLETIARSGVETAHHALLTRNGYIINTPYQRVTHKQSGSPGGGRTIVYPDNTSLVLTYYDGSMTLDYEQAYTVNGVNPFSHPSADDLSSLVVSKAKLSALSNMDKTKFSILEDLAEIKSAIGGLLKPAQNTIRAARSLSDRASKFERVNGKIISYKRKGGVIIKSKITAKELAHLFGAGYLEVKFGLAQLFYTGFTIGNLIESKMVNSAVHRDTRRYVAKGKALDLSTKSGVVQPTAANGYHLMNYYQERSFEARAGILYTIKNAAHFDNLSWQLGLGYKEIVPIAWNVMRLSWMVDRVVNVTGAIRAVENFLDPDINILSAWVRLDEKRVYTRRVYATAPRSGEKSRSVNGDTATDVDCAHTRTPWVPTIADTVPKIDLSGAVNSVGNVLDIVALAASRCSALRSKLKVLGVDDLGFGHKRTPYGERVKPISEREYRQFVYSEREAYADKIASNWARHQSFLL